MLLHSLKYHSFWFLWHHHSLSHSSFSSVQSNVSNLNYQHLQFSRLLLFAVDSSGITSGLWERFEILSTRNFRQIVRNKTALGIRVFNAGQLKSQNDLLILNKSLWSPGALLLSVDGHWSICSEYWSCDCSRSDDHGVDDFIQWFLRELSVSRFCLFSFDDMLQNVKH